MSLEGRVALGDRRRPRHRQARSRSASPTTAPTSRSTTGATKTRPRETVAEIEKLGRRADGVRRLGRRLRRVRGDGRRRGLPISARSTSSSTTPASRRAGQTVADTDPAEIDRLLGHPRRSARGRCRSSCCRRCASRPRGDIVMISSAAVLHMARRTPRRTTWPRPRSRRSRGRSPRRSAATAST